MCQESSNGRTKKMGFCRIKFFCAIIIRDKNLIIELKKNENKMQWFLDTSVKNDGIIKEATKEAEIMIPCLQR